MLLFQRTVIGATKFGKSNIYRCQGYCRFCNDYNTLESYDTTEFVVLCYLPVAPHSKKRILFECSGCGNSDTISQKEWKANRVEMIAQAKRNLQSDRMNSATIIETIQTGLYYQDRSLLEFATLLAVDLPDDTEVQANLGRMFESQGSYGEAALAYTNSLRVEDRKVIRECLATSYLNLGQPEKALPLTSHIFAEHLDKRLWVVQATIDAFQQQGNHDDALALMNARDQSFPEYANTREMRKQRQISIRHENKKTSNAYLRSHATGAEVGSRRGIHLARWASPAVILTLIVLYFGICQVMNDQCTIYLVNGSDVPYPVLVNGESLMLTPKSSQKHRVARGRVVVETRSPEFAFEATHATIENKFHWLPTDDNIYIFNPDGLALLIEQSATYAASKPPVNPPGTLRTGEFYYLISPKNYVFEPFPATIQLQNNATTATRTRIGLEPIQRTSDRLAFIKQIQLNQDQQIEYMKRFASTKPDDAIALTFLAQHMKPKPLVEYLKSGIGRRPLAVSWHCLYQSSMEKSDPAHNLLSEYRKLAADLGTGDAYFLLGQITRGEDEALGVFKKAAIASPPSGYAMYAIGNHHLVRGEFKSAREWMELAYNNDRLNPIFQNNYTKALLATREYNRIITLSPSPDGESIDRDKYIAAVLSQSELLIAQERSRIVQKAKDDSTDMSADKRTDYLMSVSKTLDEIMAIGNGDVAKYLSVQISSEDRENFYYQFLDGNYEKAAGFMQKCDDPEASLHGLLYLAAKKKNLDELAERHWSLMIQSLLAGDSYEMRLAKALRANDAGELSKALDCRLSLDLKPVLLLVAAEEYPDDAARYRELAGKLNFDCKPQTLAIRYLEKLK